MNFWWPFGIKKSVRDHALTLFGKINAAARQPALYTDAGIPDTMDGRFQSLGLFMSLAMAKLSDKDLRQALFDRFFMTCEVSLREIGIGDLGIPKKLKNMMTAFHGHAASYEACLRHQGDWNDALRRNVYGTLEESPSEAQLGVLKNHIDRFVEAGIA